MQYDTNLRHVIHADIAIYLHSPTSQTTCAEVLIRPFHLITSKKRILEKELVFQQLVLNQNLYRWDKIVWFDVYQVVCGHVGSRPIRMCVFPSTE